MSNNEILGAHVAEGVVLPEWIDVNGHMNVAYYVLAFDLGVDALWEDFGITTDYIERSSGSTFAVECHVTYQQELLRRESQRGDRADPDIHLGRRIHVVHAVGFMQVWRHAVVLQHPGK